MNEIYLVSPNRVKTITVISDNVDEKYLLSSIREAQDIYYQQIVGTNLLNKLKELVSNDEINNDEHVLYKELLDKSQYFLAYAVVSQLIVNTTYKVSNIGLNTTTDEQVQVPSVNDTLRIRDEYIAKRDYYQMLLQKFLHSEFHKGNFKELGQCNYDKIHANLYSSASCNFNLGLARGKNGFPNRKCHRK